MNDVIEVLKQVSCPDVEQRRKAMERLETFSLQHEQLDIPVKHLFCGDIYARQIFIPAGALITGRIQKFDHFDVMIYGDMTVSTDTGETMRLTGYNLMEGKAGKKRAGIAHKDTMWVTFHSSPEQDPEVMLDYLTCPNFDAYHSFQRELGRALATIEDRDDYQVVLKQMGYTESQARLQAEDKSDQIPMPMGYDNFIVQRSSIEGVGVYLICDLSAGSIVGPARLSGMRTPLGRYVNHAKNPNAVYFKDEHGDVYLQLIKDVKGCSSERPDEVTVNYRQALTMNEIYLKESI